MFHVAYCIHVRLHPRWIGRGLETKPSPPLTISKLSAAPSAPPCWSCFKWSLEQVGSPAVHVYFFQNQYRIRPPKGVVPLAVVQEALSIYHFTFPKKDLIYPFNLFFLIFILGGENEGGTWIILISLLPLFLNSFFIFLLNPSFYIFLVYNGIILCYDSLSDFSPFTSFSKSMKTTASCSDMKAYRRE